MNFKDMVGQMQMGMPAQAPAASKSASPSIGAVKQAAPEQHSAPKSDPGTHLKAAHHAHAKGDHAGAKKHALKAVNLLQKLTENANAVPGATSAPPQAVPGGVSTL